MLVCNAKLIQNISLYFQGVKKKNVYFVSSAMTQSHSKQDKRRKKNSVSNVAKHNERIQVYKILNVYSKILAKIFHVLFKGLHEAKRRRKKQQHEGDEQT